MTRNKKSSGYNKPSYDREFSDESYGSMVDSLNTVLGGLLLSENMSGQVIENIELPVDGSEVRISHNLKVVPKYRIILRQSGQVFDGETEWTDKYIYLKAGGFSGVFQKDIAITGGLVSGSPTWAFTRTSSAGNYNLAPLSPSYDRVILRDSLNDALTGDSENTIKVSILLMRG